MTIRETYSKFSTEELETEMKVLENKINYWNKEDEKMKKAYMIYMLKSEYKSEFRFMNYGYFKEKDRLPVKSMYDLIYTGEIIKSFWNCYGITAYEYRMYCQDAYEYRLDNLMEEAIDYIGVLNISPALRCRETPDMWSFYDEKEDSYEAYEEE